MKLDWKKMDMYTGWNNPTYTYSMPDFINYCTDGIPWQFGQFYIFLFED